METSIFRFSSFFFSKVQKLNISVISKAIIRTLLVHLPRHYVHSKLYLKITWEYFLVYLHIFLFVIKIKTEYEYFLCEYDRKMRPLLRQLLDRYYYRYRILRGNRTWRLRYTFLKYPVSISFVKKKFWSNDLENIDNNI